MQMRVDQLVPYGYTDTAISTFHAFGDRLVREFALELGLPPDVRVLSPPETVVFLRERLFELELDEYRPLGDPTRFLDALATLFSRAKDEDVSPDAYLAHAGRLADRAAEATAAIDAAGEAATEADRDAAAALAEDARRQAELAARLCPLPGPARRERVDRLRGPGLAGPAAAARVAGGPRGRPAAVQVRARRRVPGHQSRPGGAGRARGRATSQRHRGRRRRPVDLQVPRRGHQQHPGVPRAVPAGAGGRAPAELPLPGPDPRGGLPAGPPQRPGPARGRSRGSCKRLDPERGGDDAAPVRHEAFASGAEEADWIAGDIARRVREGARPRDVAVLVRTNAAADPILRSLNLEGIPWRFSGHERALLAARGPAAARVPARDRGPVVVGGRLRARGVGPLRAGRQGPRRDRQHRAPAQPVGVRHPRRAGAAAGHPAPLPGDPRRGVAAGRRPAALRRARQRAAGRRGAVRVPAGIGLAGDGWPRRSPSPPRRRCRTSPGSSTSSGRSRRCSPTTGPCSSRVTSRR